MGGGASSARKRAEVPVKSSPGQQDLTRVEEKDSDRDDHLKPSVQSESPHSSIHARDDDELEERLRLLERDSDLLLDDDEVLGNLDEYSDIDEGDKDSHESGTTSEGGNQNNRESWNMLKHSLEIDDQEMMLNLLYFGEGGVITDSNSLGKALDGAMTETYALHSENNTPYKLNPAKDDELASLTTEIMDESLSESMKDLNIGSMKAEEKVIEGPESIGCGVECVICREDFEMGDKLTKLPKCAHIFHSHCITKWLAHQDWCPICRMSLSGVQKGVGGDSEKEKINSMKIAAGDATTSSSSAVTEGVTA